MGAHAALYGDPRFILASWPARAVYQQLLDGRDAIGDWVAPRGDDLVPALAATVRCDLAEAASILAELERRGLVELAGDRIRLLVASGRGARGGMSATERKRASRAKQTPAPTGPDGGSAAPSDTVSPPDVTGSAPVTGSAAPDVTARNGQVTPPVTGSAPLTNAADQNANPERAQTLVTGPVTDSSRAHVTGDGHGTEGPSLPPASPSPALFPSPRAPLSISLPSSSPPSLPPSPDRGAAEAPTGDAAPEPGAKGEPKAKSRPKRAPVADAPDPEPGTLARRIRDAIAGDLVLSGIVARPNDFAARIAAPEYAPGVDVLAQVLRAAEYASRQRPGAYSDGRRFLSNWLARAAQDASARGVTAANTTTAKPSAGFQRSPTAADFRASIPAGHAGGAVISDAFGKVAPWTPPIPFNRKAVP